MVRQAKQCGLAAADGSSSNPATDSGEQQQWRRQAGDAEQKAVAEKCSGWRRMRMARMQLAPARGLAGPSHALLLRFPVLIPSRCSARSVMAERISSVPLVCGMHSDIRPASRPPRFSVSVCAGTSL
jgi:hypothetical protein